MFYYPIIIPTLNRYTHLKNCIDSLSQCVGAENTELYISLDYPPSEKYAAGYDAIRSYLPSIKGFKNVVIIEQKENLGAIKNLEFLISIISKKYKACIFTEDDNIFSPNFLEFLNFGLERYAHDKRITSVSGYSFPYMADSSKSYLMLRPIASAWGVGWWLDKDQEEKKFWTTEFQISVLKSWKQSFKILITNPRELSMLMRMVRNKEIYGDAARSISNIVNKEYQLFPSISMVRNMGHDGSGENCCPQEDDIYSNQEIDQNMLFAADKGNELKYCNRKVVFDCMMPCGVIDKIKTTIRILLSYYRFRYNFII